MKKIIILLVVLLVTLTVTFAYMVTSVQSNELDIEIGVPDNATAIIETDLLNKVLIPYSATKTQANEVNEYRVYLRVTYSESVYFTMSDNLPSEYEIICSATTFLTNTNCS
jgi:uncharacterized protein YpmS